MLWMATVFGEFNGVEIHARPSDTFVDMTEMCQAQPGEGMVAI